MRIAGETDLGSIRPNYHVALHDAHRPASDSMVYNVCKRAARQIGELSRCFHGVAVLFAGCAEIFYLDTPSVNDRIDAIPNGRSTFVKHTAEILKIMQNYGVDCFPCAKPEGLLGTLLTKYKKSDTPWGRVHLQPHPVMAAELAYFMQDVVLYVNTQCQIESLTLGPRKVV